MAETTRSYHHGDLRAALVSVALQKLEQGGHEALTLRSLAAAAGVSPMAPYAHFKDKRELLAAVAEEGFREFANAMRQSSQGDGGALAAFLATGRGYVRFALTRPSLFKLMFSAEVAPASDFPNLQAASEESYDVFRSALTTFLLERRRAVPDSMQTRVMAWSLVHGLALLLVEQRLDARNSDALVDSITLHFSQLLQEA